VESLGANSLYVFLSEQQSKELTGEVPRLLLSEADLIAAQAPAVQWVSPTISSSLAIGHHSRTVTATVQGVTPDFLKVRNIRMAQGIFWDEAAQRQDRKVAVLGGELARKLFDRTNPIGQEIQINNQSFQIIGIIQRKGAFLGVNPDANAFIPITTMAHQVVGRRVPQGLLIDEIEITARDQAQIRSAAFQVTNLLTRLHGKQDFLVVANKSIQDLLGQITSALGTMLTLIAGISLLVGGIGIMNIMLVSVAERTQEIGLRKAIGAPPQAILQQFLIEATILAVAGGIVGISLGAGGMALIGTLTPFKPTVPVQAMVVVTVISGSIGLVFGVVPARQAAQLDPITALKTS
jgi:putative ABC transport system permease protein